MKDCFRSRKIDLEEQYQLSNQLIDLQTQNQFTNWSTTATEAGTDQLIELLGLKDKLWFSPSLNDDRFMVPVDQLFYVYLLYDVYQLLRS